MTPGRDDAGDGVDDGDVAVVGLGAAAFLGAVRGVEGGVDREVRSDEGDDQQPGAVRHGGKQARAGGGPVRVGDEGGGDEGDGHQRDDGDEHLLDDAVDVAQQQERGDGDGADDGPHDRAAAEQHREAEAGSDGVADGEAEGDEEDADAGEDADPLAEVVLDRCDQRHRGLDARAARSCR